MEIIDKINALIEQRGMSKKEFALALQQLEPRLKSTGDIPNIQTIYGYLNGKRELKVELIPFIADVLGVSEQELFSGDIEFATDHNMRYTKEIRELAELLLYAPKPVREEIKALLLHIKVHSAKTIRSIRKGLCGNRQ